MFKNRPSCDINISQLQHQTTSTIIIARITPTVAEHARALSPPTNLALPPMQLLQSTFNPRRA
jgi:hypothetical protein